MRVVCSFSCGAASAVATKMAITKYSASAQVVVHNAFLKEEHPDNRRFLADCEQWFGLPVQVVQDTKYGASAREVFRRRRYLMGPRGAPCTKIIKRSLLNSLALPGDLLVLGYTADEQGRLDDWIDANNDKRCEAPLIDAGLTKADVLAIVARAGIELPLMYRLGFHNANCIGCVKGGMGYWNKVREHFPADFEEMAQIQESIGPGANFFRQRSGPLKGQRFTLRELRPDQGRYPDEPSIECGASCEFGEDVIAYGDLA
jgi:hypothetical protein